MSVSPLRPGDPPRPEPDEIPALPVVPLKVFSQYWAHLDQLAHDIIIDCANAEYRHLRYGEAIPDSMYHTREWADALARLVHRIDPIDRNSEPF